VGDLRPGGVGKEQHAQPVLEPVLRDALDGRDRLEVGGGLLGDHVRERRGEQDGRRERSAERGAGEASDHADLPWIDGWTNGAGGRTYSTFLGAARFDGRLVATVARRGRSRWERGRTAAR
jgi:hypothetical protein